MATWKAIMHSHGRDVQTAYYSSHPLHTVNVKLPDDDWGKEGFLGEAVPHKEEPQLQESRVKDQDPRGCHV